MNESLTSIIDFLSDCFIEDRSRVGVLNFFSDKVERRLVVKGEEKLLTGLLEEDLLPPQYGAKLYHWASLYKREKELVYGAFFVCGKIEGKICRAPLVFYTASLREEDQAVYVKLHLDTWRLNRGLLDLLDESGELREKIQTILSSDNKISNGLVGEMRKTLEKVKNTQTDSLLNWPYLTPSGELEKAGKSEGASIHPAGAFGMIQRGVGARGVIDELTDLRTLKESDLSKSLKTLFLGDTVEEKKVEEVVMAPLTLSNAQELVVKNARNRSLSVCYGPPGTGKSLTIAAVAVDHASRGESVLVVSKMDHAVDVIEKKIDDLIANDDLTVRAGRSSYLKELKKYLEMCLMQQIEDLALDKRAVKRSWNDLNAEMKDSMRLESLLSKELENSIARGKVRVEGESLWATVTDKYASWRVKKRELLVDMLEAVLELDETLDELKRTALNEQYSYRLKKVLANDSDRSQLAGFYKALKKRRSAEQLKLMNELDFSVVLKALPVWLSKLDDLHRVLPMQKEMVDLLIVDEASQCDLASILPALQRARRVLIVGDPKQLRHVSFLSHHAMHSYATAAKLSAQALEALHYRNISLVDFAMEQGVASNSVVLLDEHFRSKNKIISFSNETFYNGRLNLMRLPEENKPSVLDFQYVGGTQCKKGVNKEELRHIVYALKNIYKEEKEASVAVKSSIGVISPFRKQVEAFEEILQECCTVEEISGLIKHHQLLVATAHGFQGEERDVMYISCALGNEFSSGALRFLQREDVFNVLITRAKNAQVIVHSFDPSVLPQNGLLKLYFAHQPKSTNLKARSQVKDIFANEVKEWCADLGYSVTFSHEVAGMVVDLFLTKKGKKLAIDLVGFPGEMESSLELNKARMLCRAGLKLIPIGYIEWQERKDEIKARIKQAAGG